MELKQWKQLHQERERVLLIVPYGIETSEPDENQDSRSGLLIVPYGIETHLHHIHNFLSLTFNRTLWN